MPNRRHGTHFADDEIAPSCPEKAERRETGRAGEGMNREPSGFVGVPLSTNQKRVFGATWTRLTIIYVITVWVRELKKKKKKEETERNCVVP